MKVLINVEYGGFGLSDEVKDILGEECDSMARNHPLLIKVVESIGVERAAAPLAELKIVEVPDGVKWHIANDDGKEHVVEFRIIWP